MELTLAQIHDFARSKQVFDQGKKLYDSDAITSLDIDDFSNPDYILINANVVDKKIYREVNMSIDKDDYIIHGHLCSCDEHEKKMTCAHCVAVLLKLMDETKKKAIVKTQNVATNLNEQAIAIMNKYEEQVIYSSLAMNMNTSIHIEPVLEIRKRELLALTLKVGNEKQYIVKDIALFLDDIAHNVKKSYGKDLEFIHNYYSFDAESQRLIDFMRHHIHDVYYFLNSTKYQKAPQARNMCMTLDALDEFFDIYKGNDVMHRMKEKTLINMRFTDENPNFYLTIEKDDQSNYHISLSDHDYRVFKGRNHLYILRNHILYRCTKDYSDACMPLFDSLSTTSNSFVVSLDFMAAFYNNVIMNIRKYIPLQGEDISMFAPLPLECKVYVDMPRQNVISARLMYCYGDQSYNAFSDTTLASSRNFNDEIAVRLIFNKYMTRIDAMEGYGYIEHSQDAMYEFLNTGFQELSESCEMFVSEKFKKLQIRDSVNISMGVRIESDLLEIDFDTFDFPVDELQDVLKAYRLNKKYYRMKNSSFVNIEDSALQELSSILDGMHISDKELQSGKIKVPKYRALYIDKSIQDSDMIKVDRDATFKDIIRGIKNVKDADYKVPASLKNILRNYQKVGFRWLKTMANYGFGGILADDMGIGKTLQVITLLEDEKIQNPKSISLVICPSSLILNWQSEVEKFSSQLTSIIITGNIEERKALIHQAKDYDVIITSYDYLKRDIEQYEDFTFTYQILDEAQYIKNHNTKNAISVKQIQAAHRFALTGTPIENSLSELWSIFDFLMPGYLYSYQYFKKEYEYPIVKDKDPLTLKELSRLVEPFILRRVKKDVLKELPEKVENTMMIELDEESRKLYMANVALIKDDLKKSFKEKGFNNSKIMILSMLTRLRQLCCDPRLLYENYQGVGNKIEACMEFIETCKESGKKVLLFSQFTSLLSLIEAELKKRDIDYFLLKGSTPKIQRQQYVNSFNIDDTPVFLISLKAGGTGLNLTSAEVVIHFDPWWNVSAQNQATDRAYRLGQHNNVQVVKLIAKDTIEEKIMQLQEVKQGLSDSIIHMNDGMITSMSKEEIMDLF